MSDITPGYIFGTAEGTNRLTSSKLNRMGNGATINPSFISSKPSVSGPSSGDQLIMLKADGTYARVPATAVGGGGGGDMTKAVYDTNNNAKVDHAELADAAPWAGITGKPATFPPDATAMLKSVYDTNGDGISDHAALADTAPWTGISGKPASFTPSAHAPTHLDNGTDPIPVVTTARTGLVPTLPNDSTRFLNGTGTWTAVAGGSTGDTFEYRWDTGTSAADPGSGYVRSNNANPLSASGVYISYYDRAGVFVVDISRLKSGDTFYIYPSGNATQWVRYQLSANPIDHASWYELAVSVIEPNGFAPGANASVQVAFPVKPAAHASTHLDNGIDPIPVATTTRTGSLRILSGSATQYLDGSGNWSTPAPAGTVNPGTWTSFSYQANWSQNSTAQYRIETNGTFQKVCFKGSIKKAATFTTNLAIILPVGARPSDTRRFTLAGQETNTSPDECLYTCVIDTAGNMNIYPVVRSSFVWQTWSNLQTVWLDNVVFEI
jgi:hypothetical protein